MIQMIPVASPDNYFYTVDGKILTNIYQLLTYLRECREEHYSSHVNASKNDFASWTRAVFELNDLSDSMLKSSRREDHIKAVSDFIDKVSNDNVVAPVSGNSPVSISADASAVAVDLDKQPETTASVDEASGNGRISEDKISVDKKSVIIESDKIGEKNNKIKEWSDAELEKFTKFVQKKEAIPEDERVSFLKYELNELKNMIKDLRKNEKNVLIPDLMIRSIESKIEYYAVSKNQKEYDHLIAIFNDVKREIDYCSNEQPYSYADEIIKGLELEKIAHKKS